MKKMTVLLDRFVDDDTGTTAMEYALIASVIAIALIGSMGLVGGNLASIFNASTNEVTESIAKGQLKVN